MIGRENCQMCHYLGDDKYCNYFDVFFAKCEEMVECPDGLDDEEDDDYYDDDEEDDRRMDTLFELPEAIKREKCKTCKFIDWIEYDSGRKIFYCTRIKSNRTANGLLKIKANRAACDLYIKN